jgi:MFS family permease
MDRSFDRREEQRQIAVTEAKQQPSEVHATEQTSFLSPLRKVLRNPGFWLIAVLCVFFYSSIRPFLKFATDVLVNKYGIEEVTAGWIVSILPYGTIILTPLFGNLYDRVGRGATLMLIGCIIVTLCHILIAMPIMNTTWMASIIMIFLGISFSLVPSAMWPSVPKIVPLGQLGTAYSIIYFIQNIGLMLVPMWVGNIIGENTDTNGQVNFTPPMLIFTAFGIASAITA